MAQFSKIKIYNNRNINRANLLVVHPGSKHLIYCSDSDLMHTE